MIVQRITTEVRIDFVRLADGTIKIDTFDIYANFGDRNETTPLKPDQIQAFKTPLTEQWKQILERWLPILGD
mgnify:CR=1 FL=1